MYVYSTLMAYILFLAILTVNPKGYTCFIVCLQLLAQYRKD